VDRRSRLFVLIPLGRYTGERLSNPEFVRLAESFGAAAYRATDATELESVLTRALAAEGEADYCGRAAPLGHLVNMAERKSLEK
jgi:thiamine pyrophosphate-dependent acetolactate synthase large subunit-like protein